MEFSKICLIDDHVLFSKSLSLLINLSDEFKVVQLYSNGKEFINAIENLEVIPYDIILLDVNMPIFDGEKTMNWINQNRPKLKVILLSVNDNEHIVMKMIKLGAKGYLLKDIDPDKFIEALRIVLLGGFYYSDLVTSYFLDHTRHEVKTNFNEKEIQFIKLSCTEKTYKEIAEIMFLSPKTIDNYREKVFEKTNVKTRVGMVMFAIKNGIILQSDY